MLQPRHRGAIVGRRIITQNLGAGGAAQLARHHHFFYRQRHARQRRQRRAFVGQGINLRRFGLRPLFRKRDVGVNLAIFDGDFLVEVIHQRAGGDTALFDSSARGSDGEEIEIHMISLLEKRSVQKFSLGFGGR